MATNGSGGATATVPPRRAAPAGAVETASRCRSSKVPKKCGTGVLIGGAACAPDAGGGAVQEGPSAEAARAPRTSRPDGDLLTT